MENVRSCSIGASAPQNVQKKTLPCSDKIVGILSTHSQLGSVQQAKEPSIIRMIPKQQQLIYRPSTLLPPLFTKVSDQFLPKNTPWFQRMGYECMRPAVLQRPLYERIKQDKLHPCGIWKLPEKHRSSTHDLRALQLACQLNDEIVMKKSSISTPELREIFHPVLCEDGKFLLQQNSPTGAYATSVAMLLLDHNKKPTKGWFCDKNSPENILRSVYAAGLKPFVTGDGVQEVEFSVIKQAIEQKGSAVVCISCHEDKNFCQHSFVLDAIEDGKVCIRDPYYGTRLGIPIEVFMDWKITQLVQVENPHTLYVQLAELKLMWPKHLLAPASLDIKNPLNSCKESLFNGDVQNLVSLMGGLRELKHNDLACTLLKQLEEVFISVMQQLSENPQSSPVGGNIEQLLLERLSQASHETFYHLLSNCNEILPELKPMLEALYVKKMAALSHFKTLQVQCNKLAQLMPQVDLKQVFALFQQPDCTAEMIEQKLSQVLAPFVEKLLPKVLLSISEQIALPVDTTWFRQLSSPILKKIKVYQSVWKALDAALRIASGQRMRVHFSIPCSLEEERGKFPAIQTFVGSLSKEVQDKVCHVFVQELQQRQIDATIEAREICAKMQQVRQGG